MKEGRKPKVPVWEVIGLVFLAIALGNSRCWPLYLPGEWLGFVTGARGLLVKIRVQGGDDQWFRALRSGPAEAGET